MLGIIFTGGEYPSSQIVRKALESKEAFIIAADSGLICAEEAGIKPNLIIGDMDSIDHKWLAAYPVERVIKYSADKDYTDTELAMRLAVDKGCDDTWIIGGGGGRLDHLLGIRSLFEREFFPSRWITFSGIRGQGSGISEEFTDIYCIENEKLGIRNEEVGIRNVSVFPLGDGPWKATSKGLKWPLDDLKWNRGFFGLSNVVLNGDFTIKAESGRFLIIINHEPHKPHELDV